MQSNCVIYYEMYYGFILTFLAAKQREFNVKNIVSNLHNYCTSLCVLSNLVVPAAYNLVNKCLDEVDIKRDEKKNYIKDKVRNCIVGTSRTGRFKYGWIVGVPPNTVIMGVCKEAFMGCYGIKDTFLEDLCKEIKEKRWDTRTTKSSYDDNFINAMLREG